MVMGAAISTARQETPRSRIERTKETGDPDEFRRVILPGLERAPLAKIIEAYGVAKSTASTIRSGRIPAKRRWGCYAKSRPR
jgi:hypothetical protein